MNNNIDYNVRVLALNDDNHNTTFYIEGNSTGYDMRGFVKLLAEPHMANYRIRYVYLIDVDVDDIKTQNAFDVVDCQAKHMSWCEAFDFLWHVSGKEW